MCYYEMIYFLCPVYAVDASCTGRDGHILSLQLLVRHLRILFIRSPGRDVIAATNTISIPDQRH